MANQPISGLPEASALQGDELMVVVQSGVTKHTKSKEINNYIPSYSQTVGPDDTVDLSEEDYADILMVKFSWDGNSGTATATLPPAADNTNRTMRFISDSTFHTSTRLDLAPAAGEELDGATSAYTINKAYEGIKIWSDGSEWFIIQKKA